MQDAQIYWHTLNQNRKNERFVIKPVDRDLAYHIYIKSEYDKYNDAEHGSNDQDDEQFPLIPCQPKPVVTVSLANYQSQGDLDQPSHL